MKGGEREMDGRRRRLTASFTICHFDNSHFASPHANYELQITFKRTAS